MTFSLKGTVVSNRLATKWNNKYEVTPTVERIPASTIEFDAPELGNTISRSMYSMELPGHFKLNSSVTVTIEVQETA